MKYNRTREDRFQIRTEIREKNGTREVWKTALYPEGKAHIQSFEEKYQVLDRQNPSLKLAKPELRDEGMTEVFPYLEGKTRAELLGEILTAQARMRRFPRSGLRWMRSTASARRNANHLR